MTAGVLAIGASAGLAQSPSVQKIWTAGPFSFSDELGGLQIVDVSGSGTYFDPGVVRQKFQTTGKATITVRRNEMIARALSPHSSWSTLHMRLQVENLSAASWIGFRLELQEELGKASIYGDGLSFNQLTRDESSILSNRFSKYEVEHEPGDRLVFVDGWVDPYQSVEFTIFLLDLTPSPVFYIEQVPYLPAS